MKKLTILTFFILTTLIAAAVNLFNFSPVSKAQAPVNRIYARFYQLDVIAETGQNGITNILDGVSINDSGAVAFAGQLSSGEGIFVNDLILNTPVHISPGFQSGGRLFGKPVQINNNGLVAARDRNSAATLPTRIRVWDSLNPGSQVTVVSGGTTNPYNSTSTFVSLNNNVTAADPSIPNNLVFGATKQTGELVMGTPNLIPVTTDAASRNEASLGNQRPLIADDGKIVMRTTIPTDGILLFESNLSTFVPIAADDFVGISPATADFGLSPGISDDGAAVAFYAFLSNVGTANTLNTNVGPGVFISVNDGTGARKIIRVAGNRVEDAFGDPAANNGDGVCDHAVEQCISAELGVDSGGRPINFADTTINGANRFDKNSRVAVTHLALGAAGLEGDSFVVSFIATPNHAHDTGMFSDKKDSGWCGLTFGN